MRATGCPSWAHQSGCSKPGSEVSLSKPAGGQLGEDVKVAMACLGGGVRATPCLPQAPASLPHSIAAVRLLDGFTFVIYEFWETEEAWKRWVQPCPWVLGRWAGWFCGGGTLEGQGEHCAQVLPA